MCGLVVRDEHKAQLQDDGSLKQHHAYHTSYESDVFLVEFEADYETGNETITVKENFQAEHDTG